MYSTSLSTALGADIQFMDTHLCGNHCAEFCIRYKRIGCSEGHCTDALLAKRR
jgi:hypothetical protein